MGAFLSLDLFMFFVFFEIVLVPMYFLIGGWGYGNRVYAATKFFLFTMFGSAFMFVGILATVLLGAPLRRRRDHVRPRHARRAGVVPDGDRALVVLRLRHRLRRQGAGVPVPHLAPRRPHPGAHRRFGDPRRRDAQARHLRLAALRAVPVPGSRALGPTAAAHARRHRDHLRGDRGDDAARPQAPRRLFIGRPPRLHRPRHVRLDVPGGDRRGAADDQPRDLHGSAVRARRVDLRATPHPRDRRAARDPTGRPDLRRRVHRRDALVDRRPRAERVRRRVPRARRVVPLGPVVDGRRRSRGDPRRPLPVVGLPAGVPRRGRRRQPLVRRADRQGRSGLARVHRDHRVHRRVPEADDRPRRAERRRPHRPCRGAHRRGLRRTRSRRRRPAARSRRGRGANR